MSVERAAIAGLKWTAAARLLGQVISWGSTLVVLRLLDPGDYGLMAIVATFIGIGSAVADFGLSAAIVQAPELDRSLLARLAGFVLLLHVGIAASVALASPLAALYFQNPAMETLLQVASLSFVFHAVGAVPQALAHRAMDFSRLARTELLSLVFGSAVSLWLAYGGFGVWALVLSMVGAAAVKALLLVAGGGNVRPSLRFGGLNRHLRYSATMAGSQALSSVVNQSDVIVGGRVLSPDALGLYSVSLHLATLPMQKIMGIVNQVAFSAVARLQNERERLRTRITQAVRLLAFVSVGSMWGMCAVAPELIELVLGPKWQLAVIPLQVITLVVPLRMVSIALFTAAGGVGEANVNLRNMLTSAVVWPLCFVAGAHFGGANGLAAAWLVAVPLTFTINARRIFTILEVPLGALSRGALVALAAGLAELASVAIVRHLMPALPLPASLAALVATGGLAYLAVSHTLDRTLVADLRRLVRPQAGSGA